MSDKQNNLLFRIRAETLRLNLAQAHCSLNDLPNLSSELKAIRQTLDNSADEMRDVRKNIAAWKDRIADLKLPNKGEFLKNQEEMLRFKEEMLRHMGAQWDRSNMLANILEKAGQDLTKIEERSFLVKAKSIGESIWTALHNRASELQEDIQTIEQGAADKSGWANLARTVEDANREVFNESIELLGGFALRDARLDAEVCDLADKIIELVYRPSAVALRAIPGGIARMKMKLGRIVRLRFPEWTIWALPFVAHEVWRLEWPGVTPRLKAKFVSTGNGAGLETEGLELCLADAFATYMMGPAYAYLAVTLLLDPQQPEDDMRARIIWRMLGGNNCSSGGMGGSYQDVAAELRNAWEEAMADTGVKPSAARDDSALDALVQQLRAMLPGGEFTLDQWMPLHEWRKLLLGNDSDLDTLLKVADLSSFDLRHALNAAWLARVCPGRKPADDLTKKAMDLATKLKEHAPKPVAADPRAALQAALTT